MTGVAQGYVQGFTGEHRIVKQIGILFMPVTALVLVCIICLAALILPQIKKESGIEAAAAQAADGKMEINQLIEADSRVPVISISLHNKEGWYPQNTIHVSAEASQPIEYRYICTSLEEDSGWITESSRTVTDNGTWTIQIRDATGNIMEQEITVDNIDAQAPVIRSITEKQKERQ